jgi:hypothetical protein
VIRGGAAATADEIQPVVFGPLPELGGEGFGSFRKTSGQEWIGESRIGMTAQINRCDSGQIFDERSQFLRAERTVHPHAEEGDVGDGVPKSFNGLSRDPTITSLLNKGDGSHDRDGPAGILGRGKGRDRFDTAFFVNLENRKESGFGVERVKDGFDKKKVRSAVQETTNLRAVSLHEFIKVRSARRRVIDIG